LYSWNFGDGATASGLSASHTYAAPGSYMVALTVTNDAGQSATSTQTVTVYAPPSASFSASPATTRPGVAVNFNAASSADAGGTITAYSWSFGDGTTASGPSPSHAYDGPGIYTVTLTVTGSLGLATSTSHAVAVSPPPLSARLSARKRQKLGAVLRSGVAVSVFTNTAAKATFVVTMPVHAAKQRQAHRKRVRKQTMTTLLKTRSFSFARGTHTTSLKLSRSAAAKLRAGDKTVLTIQMIVTDVYGRTLGRSVNVTVSR